MALRPPLKVQLDIARLIWIVHDLSHAPIVDRVFRIDVILRSEQLLCRKERPVARKLMLLFSGGCNEILAILT